jgi:DNA-binding MarR family transcriptional regulator
MLNAYTCARHLAASPSRPFAFRWSSSRRLFQRRELAALWAAAAGGAQHLDYADLKLLDAIRVAEARGSGATVGDVSRLLGIDPSRASRAVAGAVEKGLLRRHAAQGDGRKVILAVTARGARLQAKGSDLTRARIALAIGSWSEADRARFAELFTRFAGAMAG